MSWSKPLEDYTIPELKAFIKRFGGEHHSLWNWSKKDLVIYLRTILDDKKSNP
tara:strand:+ start:110 stop:268 length:159 start_codon:yes stop_codon:yes gene_type:complete